MPFLLTAKDTLRLLVLNSTGCPCCSSSPARKKKKFKGPWKDALLYKRKRERARGLDTLGGELSISPELLGERRQKNYETQPHPPKKPQKKPRAGGHFSSKKNKVLCWRENLKTCQMRALPKGKSPVLSLKKKAVGSQKGKDVHISRRRGTSYDKEEKSAVSLKVLLLRERI